MNQLTPEQVVAMMTAAAERTARASQTHARPAPPPPSVAPERFLLGSLPEIEADEFLIDLPTAAGDVVVCVRELLWEEAVTIEGASFRKGSGGVYFSGEAEKREVLGRAIVWVAEGATNKIVLNRDGRILAKLHDLPALEIWDRYQEKAYVSFEEAQTIREVGLAFFGGKDVGPQAMPIEVLYVDAMRLGMVHLTLAEFRSLSMAQYERLMMAWQAYSSVVSVAQGSAAAAQGGQIDAPEHAPLEFPPTFLPPNAPPSVRSRFGL